MQRSEITYDERLARQFTQFARWTVVNEFILGIGEVGLGWALSSLSLGLVGTTTLIGALPLLGSFWLMRHARPTSAVGLVSVTCAFQGLLYMLAMPGLYPVTVLFMIAAVGLPMFFAMRRLFRRIVALSMVFTVIIAIIPFLPPLVPLAPAAISNTVNLFSLPCIVMILSLLFSHNSQNTEMNLSTLQVANQELYAFKAQLELQVEQRTADLRTALATVEAQSTTQGRLLAELEQQREAIRELSVPVLPVAHDTLVMPLIGALDTSRLREVQAQALKSIEHSAAQRLLLDVTGVPVIDTQVAQGLIATVRAVRLLGADAVLVGIRPEVAQTIVGLGLDMSEIHTTNDLQTAIAQTVATSAGPGRPAGALRLAPPPRG